MLLVAVVIAKILSPDVFVLAALAYKFSSKLYQVALWGLAYIAINEFLLHQSQITRQIDPISLFAAAVAFAIVYGAIHWIAGIIKKRKP